MSKHCMSPLRHRWTQRMYSLHLTQIISCLTSAEHACQGRRQVREFYNSKPAVSNHLTVHNNSQSVLRIVLSKTTSHIPLQMTNTSYKCFHLHVWMYRSVESGLQSSGLHAHISFFLHVEYTRLLCVCFHLTNRFHYIQFLLSFFVHFCIHLLADPLEQPLRQDGFTLP